MDLVLRGERILIDGVVRPASVAVAGGMIVAVGAQYADHGDCDAVEIPGSAVLLPGFVDTHVHVNDPGTEWEGFATATAAAASAGITTVVDMPLDCEPVTTSVAALDIKRAAAQGNCMVDVGYWAGIVPGNADELAALAAAGVRGFKCFLADSGNPSFGRLSRVQFTEAAQRVADLGSVLLVHAESHDVIAGSPGPAGADYDSFLRSRPDGAEVDAVNMVLDTARATGARVHIVHVSSARVLPIIADARAAGTAVTAETCPHYLTFAAETVPDGGTEYAACPPIRSAENSERLWSGLADETIDMVVSDHSPCAPELKGDGDFGVAFGGISSLQLGPRAVWTQSQARGFGLADLSRWMSARPAALAGFADRGRIAAGMRADLCVFDPDVREVVRGSDLLHRHGLTPYDGMSLRGAVLRTLVAGRRVYERAEVAA
jgi:allantoinase